MRRRRYGRNSSYLKPAFMVVALFAIVFLTTFLPTTRFGTEWAGIGGGVTLFIPWLLLLGVTVGVSTEVSGWFLMIPVAMIGFTNAMVFSDLNDMGVGIDEFITASFTIGDLMLLTFLIWLGVGVFVSYMDSRG